ncbi:ATP-dependent nuclease [Mesorhizobium hawassense]|nr:TOPRIM nucleotidyl transferase/hydrolase domain-containing protein [Mesorhizobium hawassense]
MRLCNFRCFGPEPSEIQFDDMTFVLGPNGSGKTAVLQALAKMFGLDPAQRKVRPSDFHVPIDEQPANAPPERNLWLEADFEFPELTTEIAEGDMLPAVPGNFAHMQMETDDQSVLVRFRLQANLDQDGDIEESFTNVVRVGADGSVQDESRVSKQDRNAVQVHYLPARRNPADHISYSANALLGRVLRAARWTAERDAIHGHTKAITDVLTNNAAVAEVGNELTKVWGDLHTGKFYANPSVSFARSEIENLLRHLSLSFTPGHDAPLVDFSRLSDGQQSLLYIALVLAIREIGDKIFTGELAAFDIDKLRPPIFMLIAVEEPENSLSPHYLGRVIRVLSAFAKGRDTQSVVATHAPSLLRRVEPERVRYLRLDGRRSTVVSRITMPADADVGKYVREGIQAFPELYFSRLVILGEGDSEEVVLPRLLGARGMLADDASISVVPLGGRHVNHFWRLLNDLGIPHVTLLDLDLARHQGGWGRIRYAAKQLLLYGKATNPEISLETVETIPEWNGEKLLLDDDEHWFEDLEGEGVFFSSPLDLDFMMLEAFGSAYDVDDLLDLEKPDEKTAKAVLGKSHDDFEDQYTPHQLQLFDAYYRRFKLGSKPSWHIRAMAALDDETLLAKMPAVIRRMFDSIEAKLEALSE